MATVINTIPYTFSTLEIGEALRNIARKKNRPHFPVVVHRDVRNAIKDGTEHFLKNDVLIELGAAPVITERYIEQSKGLKIDVPNLYSDDKKEKLKEILEWSEAYGNLTRLSRHLGISAITLKRYLRMRSFIDDSMLQVAHDRMKQEKLNESLGIDKRIGTRINERFFVDMLDSYCKEVMNKAYRDICMMGAKHHSVRQSFIMDEFVKMGKWDEYTPNSRKQIIEDLADRKLVILNDAINPSGIPDFKLYSTAHIKVIYKLAFNQILDFVANDSRAVRYKRDAKLFSRTEKGREVVPELIVYAHQAYGISINAIAA